MKKFEIIILCLAWQYADAVCSLRSVRGGSSINVAWHDGMRVARLIAIRTALNNCPRTLQLAAGREIKRWLRLKKEHKP